MGPMEYGYARASADDQTTAQQLAALKRAPCTHIYGDQRMTGANAGRPALSRRLQALTVTRGSCGSLTGCAASRAT